MAGRVDFFFGPVGLVLPHIQSGKLAALVVNGAKRSAALPNVPTAREAGLVGAEYPIWFGIFLPKKTPRGIVDTLNRETLKALKSAKAKERLANMGLDPLVMSPSEFDAHVAKEIALNATLVKAVSIKTD